jgi:fatty acid desaturase 2 (delta-6 desaturase)
MPQRLQHDVDLATMPFLAFNSKVVNKENTGKNFFVRHQAKLFLTLDSLLVMFFWKLYLCPRYAWKKGQYTDLAFMLLHYYVLVPTVMPWLYILSIWLGSAYMYSQFALSHTHLPVAEEPKHWVEYCLSHTVDIEPSWWCDWVMGYLNYQIVSNQ